MLILFLDLETNALIDPHEPPPRPLEAAWIITEEGPEAIPLARGQALISYSTADRPCAPNDAAASAMHEESGLLAAYDEGPQISMSALDGQLAMLLRGLAAGRGIQPDDRGFIAHLAGGGVAAFDRHLVRAWLPQVDQLVHYRPADTSVLRTTLALMGLADLPDVEQVGVAHRAADDVETAWLRWRAMAAHLTTMATAYD